MFPLPSRRFHSLFIAPFLVPFLLLVNSKNSYNNPPVAVEDSFQVHGATQIDFLANDYDPDPGDGVTFDRVGDYPQNGTFYTPTSTTPYYRYVPNLGYVGSDSFTYRVQDGFGAYSNFATVTLDVRNSAPTPGNDSFTIHGFTRFGEADLEANDSDPDGDGFYFDRIVTYPANGNLYIPSGLSPQGYTPNLGYTGPDSFSYRICDVLGLCGVASVSLDVRNSAPTARNDSFTIHGFTRFGEADLLANDSDSDGDSISFDRILTYPEHGALYIPNGIPPQGYTPNQGYTGSDSFSYRICDNLGLCANATVTLDVRNSAPTPGADSFPIHGFTRFGESDLLANDSDPDGDQISFDRILDYPQHGSLYIPYGIPPQGYTPNSGYTGPDSFTYRICDNLGLCASATVSLDVRNSAPVAGPDNFRTHINQALSVAGPPDPLIGNDNDPDGDSLTVSSYTQPAHGSVNYSSGSATLGYQPSQDYAGPDSFTYQVCDNLGKCSTGSVMIEVTPNDDGEDNGDSCESVGEPINVSNGNVFLQQADYSLPGVGPAIKVTRTYNSNTQRAGLFGKGWSTDYDEGIQVYNANYVRWFRGDGQATNFMRLSGSGPFAPVEGDFYGSLVQNGDGSFAVSFKVGSVHRFTSGGKLSSLTDINGNTTTLAYTSGKLASITDPFGRVVTATTDTGGRVLTLTDSIGKFATYTYGTSGQLLSVTYADTSKYQFTYTTANGNLVLATVTDALNNILENHTYDSQGRGVTSEKHGGVEHYSITFVSNTETDITDALGRITKYFFDKTKGRNLVTQIQGLCGCGGGGSETQSWTYDNQMNVSSHTNALNQTVSYTYDTNGNRLSGTSVLGTSSFTYNSLGQVLTTTDAMGGVTTNTYDGAGNLLSVTDALNNTTNFTYDARSELLTMTNARGKVTTLAYDTKGNVSQTIDALSNITKFAYDARGRLTSATDALNFVTSYGYDAAGRLNKITRPDASIISYTYDLAGRRTKITDPLRFTTTFAYDSAYRLTTQTDALSKSVSYSYDVMSNLTGTTDQLGHTTNVTYDEFNRPTTITHPPAVTGGPRLQETTGYDAAGNVTSRTDTAGRVTSFAYDNANRLASMTDPLLQVTQYEYNARSNLTAVVDALNQRYTFDYDALSRGTAMTRAGWQMTYAYDEVGNRTQRVDYNNMPTNYAYDALNRLTKITYPDSTTATYGYDKLSQLTSAANINGSVSFVYDNMRRLTSTTDVWGQLISYVYDVNGRRTQMSLGSTKFATYTYDSDNRLTKITDNAGKSTSYTYDAASNLLTRTLSNSVVSTYTYDGLNRLTRLKDAKSSTVIADNNYTYNDANQIVQNVDQSGTHAYGYDALDRLTSASYPATGNESYAYDAVGNRTISHRSASYGYQPFNRLTNTDTASYLYDSNGNMTTKSDSSGTTQLTWDFENRLTSVVTPTAGSVTYKYDALGRRIQRTPSSGVSTNFSYDGADVVRDKNSDATTIDYLNGGIDNKIWQKGAVQYFFSQDHLGSTNALTNASGALVERETYDAYGNTSGTSLTRYGYTGRERDSLSGLQYNRARWYDGQLGRFISEDPIGLLGGINQFAYVGDNPLKRIDPSGLYEIDVHYYLTYYFALRAGCSDKEAREIANGDQGVDENDLTKPGPGWKKKWYDPTGVLIWTEPDYRQQQVNADYHALHGGSHQPYLDKHWSAATVGCGDLAKLGIFFHYQQDMYSHEGYDSPLEGHGPDLHYPDKTANDVEKAMRMARDTWRKMSEFAVKYKCHCQGARRAPDWDLIRKFMEASGGPNWREINNEEIDVKRQILGLPQR